MDRWKTQEAINRHSGAHNQSIPVRKLNVLRNTIGAAAANFTRDDLFGDGVLTKYATVQAAIIAQTMKPNGRTSRYRGYESLESVQSLLLVGCFETAT